MFLLHLKEEWKHVWKRLMKVSVCVWVTQVRFVSVFLSFFLPFPPFQESDTWYSSSLLSSTFGGECYFNISLFFNLSNPTKPVYPCLKSLLKPGHTFFRVLKGKGFHWSRLPNKTALTNGKQQPEKSFVTDGDVTGPKSRLLNTPGLFLLGHNGIHMESYCRSHHRAQTYTHTHKHACTRTSVHARVRTHTQ